ERIESCALLGVHQAAGKVTAPRASPPKGSSSENEVQNASGRTARLAVGPDRTGPARLAHSSRAATLAAACQNASMNQRPMSVITTSVTHIPRHMSVVD